MASQEQEAELYSVMARYRAERDKRLNARGNNQYLDVQASAERYAEADPFVENEIDRDPISAEVEVLIVGAGFSGILAAARLHEAGIRDIHIIDAAADFGGTWYWNRYPGVQCDIESYCYLPLLEETGYVPKEKYSFGDEIMSYCQQLGRTFDLYSRTSFQTRVTDVTWDEKTKRWTVRTNRGDNFSARYFMLGVGRVSRPKLPSIKGIERFKGHSFHTSRWDYDYTGGSSSDDLDKLADKRVAVIGTGATAIQLIPRVAKTAKQLYVFQRTPSSVGERGNRPTDIEWYKSLPSGWQERRRALFQQAAAGQADDEEVRDGWTETGRKLRETTPPDGETLEEMGRRAMLIDLEITNGRRARIDQTVKDPATAETLKAWYSLFCKRPTFNDEFLPVFNQPNVELVDVSGDNAISEITEKGIIAGGKEYEVDLIIYASGFHIIGAIQTRVDFPIKGRNGLTLADHWANGMRTVHGLTVHNFPNWFYLGQGQNAVAANYTSTVDCQAKHIAWLLSEARERGVNVIEPTPEAEEAWCRVIKESSTRPAEYYANCTPGYYNNEGQSGSLWDENYAPGQVAFDALLEKWRKDAKFEGLNVE